MSTFLFDKIIFGPVASRRLGNSLGINLLPTDRKICNFDCIYCECGLTEHTTGEMPESVEVINKLHKFLHEYKLNNKVINTITFAGNGEPTIHKDFLEIVKETARLRDEFYPKADIALLSNATTLTNSKVLKSFEFIDQVILKLDSVNPSTIKLLNCPVGSYDLSKTIELMKTIPKVIIQTLFVKGKYKGQKIDNTTETELTQWLKAIEKINPMMVMIYTIARDTPVKTLIKATPEELDSIAEKVRQTGIKTQISY